MKIISKRAAAELIDTDAAFDAVEKEWTTDYGCSSAKLVPAAANVLNGKVTKSGTIFTLVLDGEPTEINYAFYAGADNAISLDPTHWYD